MVQETVRNELTLGALVQSTERISKALARIMQEP